MKLRKILITVNTILCFIVVFILISSVLVKVEGEAVKTLGEYLRAYWMHLALLLPLLLSSFVLYKLRSVKKGKKLRRFVFPTAASLMLLIIIFMIGFATSTSAPPYAQTEPFRSNQFVNTIVNKDNEGCGVALGIKVYFDSESYSWMKLNNVLIEDNNKERKESLFKIVSFLEKNTLTPYQNIDYFEDAFRDYCGRHSSKFIKEIPNISYPNTDKARAIMIYAGQADVSYVEVAVFAKRYNDIIYLQHYLEDEDLYESVKKECGLNNELFNFATTDAEKTVLKCYMEKLQNNKKIEETARSDAQRLISLFEI